MKNIVGASIIACGLVCFGYYSSKMHNSPKELIEVRGLSEKVVKADLGEMGITIISKNVNLEALYKKRMSDKEKVLAFLKEAGISDSEIIGVSTNTIEHDGENKRRFEPNDQTVDKEKYFKADDTINIRTKALNKIDKIKADIIKLSSDGVLVSYDYSYKLTNFLDIKLSMMNEASENAKKTAEVFVKPHNIQIGDVAYLRQGEISIRAEEENENVENWNSKETKSINKKLRLVVRAGFKKR